jgi:hypothetical protein
MRRAGLGVVLLALAGCQSPTVYVQPPAPPEPRFAELAAAPALPPVPLAGLRARLDAARHITSPFERDESVKQLVKEAAEQGDAAEPAALTALVADCLAMLNSPFVRDEAAGGCVRTLARRGLTTEAVAVAHTMSNPFSRNEAIKAVVGGKP